MTTDLPATTVAAGQPPGETGLQPATARRVHRFAVGTLTALMAVGYSAYCLARYHTFHYNAYDLVIFDQAVRSYAHLRPGISIIKGLHNGFGPHFSVLGDHWSPILAVLAPVHWLYNSGRVGVHEVAFAPVLTAVALERNARMTAAAAAVSAVPPGVTVEAAGGIGPDLPARDTVLLWDGENPPRWAPWVVADVAQVEFSFTTIKAEKQRVAMRRQHGYRSVFDQRGYIVLHRASTVARTGLYQAAGR